jgi:hypothetical protein
MFPTRIVAGLTRLCHYRGSEEATVSRLPPLSHPTSDELPVDMEYVPGLGIARKLDKEQALAAR